MRFCGGCVIEANDAVSGIGDRSRRAHCCVYVFYCLLGGNLPSLGPSYLLLKPRASTAAQGRERCARCCPRWHSSLRAAVLRGAHDAEHSRPTHESQDM